VSKASGRTTAYLRGPDGRVLSEYSYPTGTSLDFHWNKDYIYAHGRHVAAVENTDPEEPAGVMSDASDPALSPWVSMAWGGPSVGDLYGYHVYRATGIAGPYTRITAAPVTTPSYIDGAVLEGTAYFYELTAVDEAGLESRRTAPRKITPGDATPPAAVSDLTGGYEDFLGVSLNW